MIKSKEINTENRYVGEIINRQNGITLIALVITIVLNTFGVVVVNK